MALLSLVAQRHPLATPQAQLEALGAVGLARFEDKLQASGLAPFRATRVDTLQINVGRKCNQTCSHCHVDAGPDREEMMEDDVVDAVLQFVETHKPKVLDITGGAPELHNRFEEMVMRARKVGTHVIDRCNLTILTVRKYAALHEFLAAHQVEVVASLPYHSASNTDAQRGDGVFEKSITALKKLNAVGYGVEGKGLSLTLVTNPVGAFLPAPQAGLEADFRRVLRLKHGIEFTQLFCITNMPISRYLEWLVETGNLDTYMQKLVNAYNPQAASGAMCRTMLSVGYDGRLFDCDFNQMLDMPVTGPEQRIQDVDIAALGARDIATFQHCYGCTAGQGSSCGGALS